MKERTQDLLLQTHAAAFSYDHESGFFLRDNDRFAPEDLPTGWGALAAETDPEDIPDSPLIYTIMGPVMLPQFHDWMEENFNDDIANETVTVMQDVVARLEPSLPKRSLSRDRGGFMGIDVSLPPSKYSHVFLQTLGNCACLSVESSGVFRERQWQEKVAALSFHNTDTLMQRASLLAGLGHIAHKISHLSR